MGPPTSERDNRGRHEATPGSDDRLWTVAELLALHPWPSVAMQAGGPRLEWLWHYDVPVSPDARGRAAPGVDRSAVDLGRRTVAPVGAALRARLRARRLRRIPPAAHRQRHAPLRLLRRGAERASRRHHAAARFPVDRQGLLGAP